MVNTRAYLIVGTNNNKQFYISPEDEPILTVCNWSMNEAGYIVGSINGRTVQQHRLIAERMLGRKLKPGYVVDHINGVRSDNTRENLREVPPDVNAQNKPGVYVVANSELEIMLRTQKILSKTSKVPTSNPKRKNKGEDITDGSNNAYHDDELPEPLVIQEYLEQKIVEQYNSDIRQLPDEVLEVYGIPSPFGKILSYIGNTKGRVWISIIHLALLLEADPDEILDWLKRVPSVKPVIRTLNGHQDICLPLATASVTINYMSHILKCPKAQLLISGSFTCLSGLQ